MPRLCGVDDFIEFHCCASCGRIVRLCVCVDNSGQSGNTSSRYQFVYGVVMARRLVHPQLSPSELEKLARFTPEDFARAAAVQREAVSAKHEPTAPQLPWQRVPPPTNRGGNEFSDWKAQELQSVDLVMRDSGEVVQVSVRKPAHNQVAFIDGLRFTIGVETWHRTEKGVLLTDGQIVTECSNWLEKIFGFGITRAGGAKNFYDFAMELGEGCGQVCYGGRNQNETMLIVIHGTGCMVAREGWEQRLFEFLQWAARPVITRIDLAHDVFDGSYFNVDYADRAYDFGWWRMGGRMPWHERVGNWKRPDGSGRTLYIGRRKNGKCCRIYEKGRQLGDAGSEWVRVEVELKNDDRIIPFNALLDPSGYFVGAYDALCVIAPMVTPARVATKTNAVQVTMEKCLENIRVSYGAYLRFFRELLGDQLAMDLIVRYDRGVPDRLIMPTEERFGDPIHSSPTVSASVETALYGVFGE